MIVSAAEIGTKGPGLVYAEGLGRYLTLVIGEDNLRFAVTFGAMAFSTFIFDTLDVSTRLGRYILQELTGRQGRAVAVVATAVTVLVPLVWLLRAGEGAYRAFWVLFGTSNQLLAALSLLGISVWLTRSGKRSWYTWAPMGFVMALTLYSLALQAIAGTRAVRTAGVAFDVVSLNAGVSIVLIGLALVLLVEAMRALRKPRPVAA
jgi:carbon starvation protein